LTYRYENGGRECRGGSSGGVFSVVGSDAGAFVGERRAGRPRFAPWAESPLT
jgi:hypothetical protein